MYMQMELPGYLLQDLTRTITSEECSRIDLVPGQVFITPYHDPILLFQLPEQDVEGKIREGKLRARVLPDDLRLSYPIVLLHTIHTFVYPRSSEPQVVSKPLPGSQINSRHGYRPCPPVLRLLFR